jgi:RNA polymerase sigma-70 factor (ECF subfamily)
MNSDYCVLTISPEISYEATSRETELVKAATAGSHAAFEELRSMYSVRLYKRVFSITRNCEDAEDALQDAFLLAYRALPSFEGRSRFSSWLTRIAINSALGILRRHRSRPEISLEQPPSLEEDSISVDARTGGLNPEELCDQRQRSYEILRAIERLDPKLRVPLRIRMSQEYSIKEIALNLGISSACVKSRLHRARKRLSQSPALRNHRTEANRQIPQHCN